jgi:hypothetical protein
MQHTTALFVNTAARAVDVLDVQEYMLQAMLESLQRTVQNLLVVLVPEIRPLAAAKAYVELHHVLLKK